MRQFCCYFVVLSVSWLSGCAPEMEKPKDPTPAEIDAALSENMKQGGAVPPAKK